MDKNANNYSPHGALMDKFQVEAFRTIFQSQTISEKNMPMAFMKAVALTSDETIESVIRDEKKVFYFERYLEMLLGNAFLRLYYSGKVTPTVSRNCKKAIKETKRLIKHLKNLPHPGGKG